jgi:hypothetical protein
MEVMIINQVNLLQEQLDGTKTTFGKGCAKTTSTFGKGCAKTTSTLGKFTFLKSGFF